MRWVLAVVLCVVAITWVTMRGPNVPCNHRPLWQHSVARMSYECPDPLPVTTYQP